MFLLKGPVQQQTSNSFQAIRILWVLFLGGIIMNFADAARKDGSFTHTENGAVALNTTGSKLLDFYGTVGALRNANVTRIESLFADAYAEDPLMATKIAYYCRDVKEGLGERKIFRTLIQYMAKYHPEALRPNIQWIGEFGRFDDLYSLIDTPLEDDMWEFMSKQFEKDIALMILHKPVSLLAKWIKTADASSKNTRRLGILTAHKLGYSVYNFKRRVRLLRKYIKVTECYMSANKWNEINYSAVPSRAMMNYRNAFIKHDRDRFNEFVDKAVIGKVKVNSNTLYPYDLLHKIMYLGWGSITAKKDDLIEAQWRQLPNFVGSECNCMVIADTSGSMNGRPIETAISLAIYFAERNTGAYHNMWMSFSLKPRINILKGETLAQKLENIDTEGWDMNTNLHAAFEKILDIAIKNHISQDEMPKSLIVISDMEIDACGDKDWTFYDQMADEYRQNSYEIPNVIFWQVNSRHNVFHADSTRKGVQLASGSSPTVFKQVMDCVGMTPVEAMYKVLNNPRYDCITIEK